MPTTHSASPVAWKASSTSPKAMTPQTTVITWCVVRGRGGGVGDFGGELGGGAGGGGRAEGGSDHHLLGDSRHRERQPRGELNYLEPGEGVGGSWVGGSWVGGKGKGQRVGRDGGSRLG